jgi:hypothetical protein
MISSKKIFQCFCGLCLMLMAPDLATAQQAESGKNGWEFLLVPYLMVPDMKGTAGVRNLPDVEVDASAKDIFRNLKFGAMLYTEAYNENWALTSDLIYMKLGKGVRTGVLITDGKLTAKQLAWEIGVLRKVFSCVELGVGGRYNSMEAGVDLTTNSLEGPVNRSREKSVNWFDPIVITRIKGSPTDKLILQLRADIGGFGVGSDLAWQGQAYADYRFCNLFQLGLGYRILSVDYEKGTGEDRFLYDVKTSGPVIRFGFNF